VCEKLLFCRLSSWLPEGEARISGGGKGCFLAGEIAAGASGKVYPKLRGERGVAASAYTNYP